MVLLLLCGNREDGWTARGGCLQRKMWLTEIWVWGKLPSWTFAQEQLSAPLLETRLQAASWTCRKVQMTTQFTGSKVLMCPSQASYLCTSLAESSDDDHLTMEDLISYSFQVAKGMEFLSSRKVKSLVPEVLCAHAVIKAGDNTQSLVTWK